jgi:HD-like signal output (HDOD) protein
MKPVASASDTTIVQSVEYNEARAISAALVAELDRSLADNDLNLPSLPEVALKIRNALANEDVSVAEISRLIGSDPALAARIVKIANSALFYRGSKPITSVSAAVSQLGHRMVRNVALSYASQQVFIGYGSQPVREFLTSIWQHSVHTAALAHMLARVRTKLNPDDAFLAGLLHEVGKLYILMRVKDKIEQLASEAAFQAVVAEWHPRLGRAVIESWGLPEDLAAAVGEHQACALEAPEPPRLTDVVAVANYLAENSEAACADENYFDKAPDLGSLAMDKPTFDWLIRAGDVDVRLLMIAFGV